MGRREGCIRPKACQEKLRGWTGLLLFGSVLSLAASNTNTLQDRPSSEGHTLRDAHLIAANWI